MELFLGFIFPLYGERVSYITIFVWPGIALSGAAWIQSAGVDGISKAQQPRHRHIHYISLGLLLFVLVRTWQLVYVGRSSLGTVALPLLKLVHFKELNLYLLLQCWV